MYGPMTYQERQTLDDYITHDDIDESDPRFQTVHVGHGEHAIVDTAAPADGRPYTTCSGHRGSGAEDHATAERDALNAGTRRPDPIWYGETEG
jgi:hypothetical protein